MITVETSAAFAISGVETKMKKFFWSQNLKKSKKSHRMNRFKYNTKEVVKMKRIGEKCVLSDLKVGQKAIVLKINVMDKAIRRHLLDMGVTRGVEVKIKKIAPMGDPVNIYLRDYELCICKANLSKIEVVVIK